MRVHTVFLVRSDIFKISSVPRDMGRGGGGGGGGGGVVVTYDGGGFIVCLCVLISDVLYIGQSTCFKYSRCSQST